MSASAAPSAHYFYPLLKPVMNGARRKIRRPPDTSQCCNPWWKPCNPLPIWTRGQWRSPMPERYSVHQIKTWEKCQRKYEFDHVRELSWPSDTRSFRLGRGVHQLLDYEAQNLPL